MLEWLHLSSGKNIFFILGEIVAYITFIILFLREYKTTKKYYLLIMGIFCSFILEFTNVNIYAPFRFSDQFFISIFGIPLMLPITWSVLLYCCNNVAEKWGFSRHVKPLFVGLIAFSLDFSFDTLATKMTFWEWKIATYQQFFGVPYLNYVGWLLFVPAFFYSVQLVEDFNFVKFKKYLFSVAIPFIMMVPYILALYILLALGYLLNLKEKFVYGKIFTYTDYPLLNLYAMVLLVLLFSLILILDFKPNQIPKKSGLHVLPLSTLIGMQIFYFIIIFSTGTYASQPILLVISLAVSAFQLFIYFFPAIQKRAFGKISL